MVTLLNNCNLSILFDSKNNRLLFDDSVIRDAVNTVSLFSLLPTLLNKSLSYPEKVYNEYLSVHHTQDNDLAESDVSFDIVYMPSGLLGIEYIKSHIYYIPRATSAGTFTTVIEVLYGEITIILQKNKQKQDEFDFETAVSEGYLVKVKQGEKCAIPKGYFFTFINTSDFPAIFVKINKDKTHIDYSLLDREGGLAYYCIRKNAREEIVLNPRYRSAPHIKSINPDFFLNEVEMDWNSPLYEILKTQKTILDEVLCENC